MVLGNRALWYYEQLFVLFFYPDCDLVIRDHWCTVQSTLFYYVLAGASFRRVATGAYTILGRPSALGLCLVIVEHV